MIFSLLGCSLTTLQYEECTTNAECRDAFGFGYTCGDAGLCKDVAVEPRCNQVYPVDLFQRVENYRDAVVLGSLFDLSSDMPETQAAQLAIMQVNDYSGLDGRPFALVECSYEVDTIYDNRDQAEAAVFATDWLVNTLGIPAIVGPATSSIAEVAYEVASVAGAVLVSPSATSPSLTTIDGVTKTDAEPGMFWRTAPPDSLQGAVVAADMLDRNVPDVAVIYQTGSYGEGLTEVFVAAFTAAGGSVTLHAFEDATQRDVVTTTVSGLHPSEVLFISSDGTDVSAFLNSAAVQPGYATMPIFLTDAARDEEVLLAASEAWRIFSRIRGTAPSIPSGVVYDFFSGAYAGAYSPDRADASVYTAHSWDAAWLALYGVAWSAANEGAITGTGIARGLRRVSAGDPVDISPTRWSQVRGTFEGGAGIDVTGASGSLDFDPFTEETTAAIDVWTVGADRTSFDTIYTVEP